MALIPALNWEPRASRAHSCFKPCWVPTWFRTDHRADTKGMLNEYVQDSSRPSPGLPGPSQDLLVDQTIEKVSFCAPDRNLDKAFSYICRDGTTRRWICHCFLALKDSVSIAQARGRLTSLACPGVPAPAPTGLVESAGHSPLLSLPCVLIWKTGCTRSS